MSSQEEDQVPVVSDEQVEAEENASAEDEQATLPSEGKQLDQEAGELDESNIISDESGPAGKSLRGNRGDPMAADKEIDNVIDQQE
ncbi:hypothetical protein FA10DRAFT_302400 [Acaromyces ingoldii]|uniref:Uncharacterized protein n=1 Tax=Acaromyces ingoldii TaxID=215250 RepID=A0A316YLR7_9BASI|nr:hypothetical protein FA10DRAFT_302400 [Acaromyces ingoldii]PWN89013.1 hypothetical protein FA10DRAFT_302400 [Acaromyces ingoldii]